MSSVRAQDSPTNYLIASLPRRDRELVTESCDTVHLVSGYSVSNAGDTIRHVYFPTDSYISLIAPLGTSESVEVGMVGSEGLFGATLTLGIKTSGVRGLVQGDGPALRMPARRFLRLLDESEAFKRSLNRYLYVLTTQLAQTAACGRFHTLDARMARWLLMTHDRAHKNTFELTHQFLAYMLGVRRASVTEIAGRLQNSGLVKYTRGRLTVLDRRALEKMSCGCYAAMKACYRKYLGGRIPRDRLPG